MVYGVLAFTIFCFSLFSFQRKANERFLFGLLLFIIIIFVGLRYEVGGPDWVSYKQFYADIEPIDRVIIGRAEIFRGHGFEPGFKLMASVLKSFTDNYILLNLLVSTISLSLIGVTLLRLSPYPITSLFLYFCTVVLLADMTVVRQMLAVSIFVFSTKFIVNRNPFRFIALVFVATLFHYSAILSIPLYFLFHRYKLEYNAYIVVVFLLLKLFLGKVALQLLAVIYMIPGLSFSIYLKASQYINEALASGFQFGFGQIERLVVFILLLYAGRDIENKYGDAGRIVMFLVMVNIVVSIMLYDFSSMYLRIRYFFIVFSSVLYAMFLGVLVQKNIARLAILVYGFLWLLLVLSNNYVLYVPYRNYIFEG